MKNVFGNLALLVILLISNSISQPGWNKTKNESIGSSQIHQVSAQLAQADPAGVEGADASTGSKLSTVQASQPTETFDCQTVTDVPADDCQALKELYISTNGAGWTNHTNWLETTTVSTWFGVTVSGGRVSKLRLGSNLLNGTITSALSVLGNLRTLDLHNNQLSGSIPPELANLIALQELELYGNSLSGTIPMALGNLSQLTSLTLGLNQLSGNIPSQLGNLTNLTKLWLYDNQLTGVIPPEIGNLTKLTNLALGINQLTGSIPPELGNLTQAYVISIEHCQLSGSIPSSFGNLTAMMYLYLDHNQLSGPIPSTLGNLANLRYLELQNNLLSGSIPSSLGNLSQLSKLDLSSNQLSGSIPTQLGNLTHLTWLLLNKNELTGNIPYQLGQGVLYQLYLGDNHLTGPIPVTLSNLSATLGLLNLHNNELSSSIPPELGNLVKLVYLDLSGNQLSGYVPDSFTNLVDLCEPGDTTFPCSAGYELNLGYNRLSVPATEPPASFLALKDPDWYQTQWQYSYIPNPAGGYLLTYDGTILVTVPVGAAGKDFYLEYTPLPGPSNPLVSFDIAGLSFDLSAFDALGNPITSFTSPLIVRITYNDSELGGVNEGTLRLLYWNSHNNTWEDAVSTCPGGTYTRDTSQNWFSLPVCHFSEFALAGTQYHTLFLPLLFR